ncbi:MAG: glycosyltransferase family 2 protein [Porticoccaceae bacterium]
MKISVVTISFNQREYLKQCMDSVLSQHDELAKIGVQLEYIVVDPGSTDGSRELIESYGDAVIKIFEKDEGPADGLNKGFAIAAGDVFAYINADDYFLEGAFLAAVELFRRNDCDVFSGHGWIVDEYDNRSHRCLSHKFSLKQYALGNCVVMQQSTFFKREAFLNAGGFNENNRVSWDGELMVDMAIAGAKVIRINNFLSCFRVYSTSISGSGDFLEAARVEHVRISEKILTGTMHSMFYRVLNRIFFRLSDPYYLGVRIFDSMQYGKRVIPS